MKFLVTMKFDRAPGDSAQTAELIKKGQAFFQAQAESGKLDVAYAALEHPTKVIVITSADSHEEMLKMISSNPLAPIGEITVEPLAEVSAAFESASMRVKG